MAWIRPRIIRYFSLLLVILGILYLATVFFPPEEPENIRNDPSYSNKEAVLQLFDKNNMGVKRLKALDFFSTTWSSLNSHYYNVKRYPRALKGFLTIGIPSIKRRNGQGRTYLMQTINSIINTTTSQDRASTVLLIFLADFDSEYNMEISSLIEKVYRGLIESGFIHILQINQEYYPRLDGLVPNFNDSALRVKWRSKQVADFVAIFMYARNLSEYYIHLEDDVLCAPNFVTEIKFFIRQSKRGWALLEFSELGFIGKLFKSEDLEKLAFFLILFYDKQPVDWLLYYFRVSMAQDMQILCKPTLFQHVGMISSFGNNTNSYKDKYFGSTTPAIPSS